MGSSKHEFACISMVTVHIDTSYVHYGLPVNFTRTSSFCAGHIFIQTIWSEQHKIFINFTHTGHDAYLMS